MRANWSEPATIEPCPFTQCEQTRFLVSCGFKDWEEGGAVEVTFRFGELDPRGVEGSDSQSGGRRDLSALYGASEDGEA